MAVFRTQLKKISVIRNDIKADKIKLGQIKNDMSVTDIRELEPPKGTKSDKKALIFEYETTIDYSLEEPKGKSLGKVEIVGEVIDIEEEKTAKEIMDLWKKSKKVRPDILEPLLNLIFEEAQIEALGQAKKVGLPSPIPLPRLRQQQATAEGG